MSELIDRSFVPKDISPAAITAASIPDPVKAVNKH